MPKKNKTTKRRYSKTKRRYSKTKRRYNKTKRRYNKTKRIINSNKYFMRGGAPPFSLNRTNFLEILGEIRDSDDLLRLISKEYSTQDEREKIEKKLQRIEELQENREKIQRKGKQKIETMQQEIETMQQEIKDKQELIERFPEAVERMEKIIEDEKKQIEGIFDYNTIYSQINSSLQVQQLVRLTVEYEGQVQEAGLKEQIKDYDFSQWRKLEGTTEYRYLFTISKDEIVVKIHIKGKESFFKELSGNFPTSQFDSYAKSKNKRHERLHLIGEWLARLILNYILRVTIIRDNTNIFYMLFGGGGHTGHLRKIKPDHIEKLLTDIDKDISKLLREMQQARA